MEIELKYIVEPPQVDALREAMQHGPTHVLSLRAHYFDTEGDTLAARKIAVRLRQEGAHWVQTAKALTADSLRRLEHNVERPAAPEGEAPGLDLALHDGTPVGDAIRAALRHPADRAASLPLVERFRTEVSRLTRVIELDGASVELALDLGAVIAGERSAGISEFELELVSGPVSALFALAGVWAVDRGLWLSSVTKAERGARLARGLAHGPPSRAGTLIISEQGDPARAAVAVLQDCIEQILRNASAIGEGATDEAFVHQLGIGLERIECALDTLREVASGVVDAAWPATFRQAFEALGSQRAAKVVQARAFQRALLAVMAICESAGSDIRRRSQDPALPGNDRMPSA